jgi:lipoic acid synthetase
MSSSHKLRKPDWLKIRLESGKNLSSVKAVLSRLSLNTVCSAANCPNKMECFNRGTATFLIMGDVCTRRCRFCNIDAGKPSPLDPQEPGRIADAAEELGLKHVVITSVTRDDLADGGAGHYAKTVAAVRERTPGVRIEVLIPDFQGDETALRTVLHAGPDILNHNVETVPRLYRDVRPQAEYTRSIELLRRSSTYAPQIITKSGIMAGLGETEDEVLSVLQDLQDAGCAMLTIGQYLPPSSRHYPVQEYVEPARFAAYRKAAYGLGFKAVASAPLVRSSYHAEELHNSSDR